MRVLSGDRSVKLPVDSHILTFDQILESFSKIASDPLGKQVGIKGRSWRAQWRDQPVDISYSFIFSMTEVGFINTELGLVLHDTRAKLLSNNSADELIGVVDRSKRCGPVIGNIGLRNLLERRIQSWSE